MIEEYHNNQYPCDNCSGEECATCRKIQNFNEVDPEQVNEPAFVPIRPIQLDLYHRFREAKNEEVNIFKKYYNPDDYDSDGYDSDGYTFTGYNMLGEGRDGYDICGYDCSGYDKNGYDRFGFQRGVYPRDDYCREDNHHDDYYCDDYYSDYWDEDNRGEEVYCFSADSSEMNGINWEIEDNSYNNRLPWDDDFSELNADQDFDTTMPAPTPTITVDLKSNKKSEALHGVVLEAAQILGTKVTEAGTIYKYNVETGTYLVGNNLTPEIFKLLGDQRRKISDLDSKSIINILRNYPELQITADEFNQNEDILNTKAGTLEWETGITIPHSSEYYFTYCVDLNF